MCHHVMTQITGVIPAFVSLVMSGEGKYYCVSHYNTSDAACKPECCKPECCAGNCCNNDTCCAGNEVLKYALLGCFLVIAFVVAGLCYNYKYRKNGRFAQTMRRIRLGWRNEEERQATVQPAACTHPPPPTTHNTLPVQTHTAASPGELKQTGQEIHSSDTTFQTIGFPPPREPPPPSYAEATQSKP